MKKSCKATSRFNFKRFYFTASIHERFFKNQKLILLSNHHGYFLAIITFVISLNAVAGDFLYSDFNQTLGLTFNGDATTSDCGLNNTYITTKFDETKLKNTSGPNNTEQQVSHIGRENGLQTRKEVVTNDDNSKTNNISKLYAQFGHKDIFQSSVVDGCKTRLRLTPSAPSKKGSVWYEKRVQVVRITTSLCHPTYCELAPYAASI